MVCESLLRAPFSKLLPETRPRRVRGHISANYWLCSMQSGSGWKFSKLAVIADPVAVSIHGVKRVERLSNGLRPRSRRFSALFERCCSLYGDDGGGGHYWDSLAL
jgi:hypothetical protein